MAYLSDVTDFIAKLFCFMCVQKKRTPRRRRFPCRNHGESASKPCTCGLDTLKDGGLDFHKIAMEIGLEFNQQHIQSDCSHKEEEASQVRIGFASVFSHDELRAATNNFERKLGGGAYGSVYLGKLQNGQAVAVKAMLKTKRSEQLHQFMMEVLAISTLQHPNLVTLLGFTSPGCSEFLLVYEYMPNGTLADHLQGKVPESEALTWDQRMQIAVEVAEALAYLHLDESRLAIIHSDVKTENILFDEMFHAKVADFGLCDHFHRYTENEFLTRKPPGTHGYLDPEYNKYGKLTDRSDTYSFGVVLLELISGFKAVDERMVQVDIDEIYLFNFAAKKMHNKELDQLVDAKLGYESNAETRRMVEAVAELSLKCLHSQGTERPQMAEVVTILKKIWNATPHMPEKDAGLDKADAAITPTIEVGSTSCNFSRGTDISRLLLQDGGTIAKVEKACCWYGHNISSLLLFYLFKKVIPHRSDPQGHYSFLDKSCHCRQYLKSNKIREGIARSHCFKAFIINYIFFLAAITNTPPRVTEQNYRRFCGSPHLNAIIIPGA